MNPEDVPAIQKYLADLDARLRRNPGINPEDGLADAREFLSSEWKALDDRGVVVSDAELYRHLVRKFGPPDEVAAAYAVNSEPPVSAAVADIPSYAPTAPPGRRRAWSTASALVAVVAVAIAWFALVRSNQDHAHADVTVEPVWASRVVSFTPGNPHSVLSHDSAAVLGPADYRPELPEKGQLHSYLTLGRGGIVVVEFDAVWLCDGAGPDLRVVEVGNLAEPMDVAVSRDGTTWIDVGKTRGAESLIDIAPFVHPTDRFRFVRLTDAKGVMAKDNQWPGADVDAVCALHAVAAEQ